MSMILPSAGMRGQGLPNVAPSRQNLVTLVLTANLKSGCGPAKLDFVRVRADGPAGADAFRVPEGHALIVTDVDWLYASGGPGLTEALMTEALAST
jgi:hypothetical protein